MAYSWTTKPTRFSVLNSTFKSDVSNNLSYLDSIVNCTSNNASVQSSTYSSNHSSAYSGITSCSSVYSGDCASNHTSDNSTNCNDHNHNHNHNHDHDHDHDHNHCDSFDRHYGSFDDHS